MKSVRDISIDVTRGFAVFFMVASHVTWFLAAPGNDVWQYIREFGDTVCYILFLFLFGISAYHSLLAKTYSNKLLKKNIRRILVLVVAYFFVGAIVLFTEHSVSQLPSKIAEMLLFQNFPAFTEFLPNFFIYLLLLTFYKFAFRRTVRVHALLILVLSVVLYAIGSSLAQVNSTLQSPYLAIFSGGGNFLRFPILQYFPVVLLGILTGYNDKKDEKQKTIVPVVAGLLGSSALLIYSTQFVMIVDGLNTLKRWPPSPLFLLTGVLFSLVLLLLIRKINFSRFSYPALLGKNAISILVIHTAIVALLKYYGVQPVSDPFILGIYFTVILNSFIVYVLLKGDSLFMKSQSRSTSGSRLYPRLLAVSMILLISVSFIFFAYFFKKPGQSSTSSNTSTLITPTPISLEKLDEWYSDDFGYAIKFELKNLSTLSTIEKGETVTISFNHKKLVEEKHSVATGFDSEMVFKNSDNTFVKVPYFIKNPNTDTATLLFQTAQNLGSESSSEHYYLYYGNFKKTNSFSSQISSAIPLEENAYSLQNTALNENILSTSLNRTWIIKGNHSIDSVYQQTKSELKSNFDQLSQPKLIILDQTNTILKQSDYFLKNGKYTTSLYLADLQPGTYFARVTASLNGISHSSHFYKLQVSYPLFVNWSIDWEGFYLEDKHLKNIEDYSTSYGIPITHFFNPRIYAKNQDKNRAKTWTEWILSRKAAGDEIGLHIHMWFDMVEEAGVVARKEPYWERGINGHDVPSSAYTAEEFEKIVLWGLQKFKENGLGIPEGYRAGGWQISLEELKVLDKLGFMYDSSARDYTKFGAKQMEVPWKLTQTSQPYKPNTDDMNKSVKPTISLWEFPNNGENSSNHGPNSTHIIDSFYSNYKLKPLNGTTTFVFLSHVQLFQNDMPVLDRTLPEISKHSADLDEGPVIFATIDKILPEYE